MACFGGKKRRGGAAGRLPPAAGRKSGTKAAFEGALGEKAAEQVGQALGDEKRHPPSRRSPARAPISTSRIEAQQRG